MKQIFLILAVVMGQSVMAVDAEPASKEQSAIIERAIRNELKKPAGELTKADLEKVTELNLNVSSADRFRSGARIKKAGLEEVAKLTQLESLKLHGNKLTDASPLANLTQLGTLSLSHNKLTDISPLAKLTRMKDLNLESNQITDIDAFVELTQLKKLRLYGNQLTDLSALAKLTQLERLDEAHEVEDAYPLRHQPAHGPQQQPTHRHESLGQAHDVGGPLPRQQSTH